MKKIIICLLFMLVMTISMAMHGEIPSPLETIVPQDSTINIIAWFNKHDTATYRVNEYSWKLNDTDTVLTASYSMIVSINVVDSTAKGYKMDYTFLDFPTDALPDSASVIDRFQNQITDRLARKIVGTTVHFETDEYGRITRYNNLGQIKKQARSLFKEALNEFSKLPEIQGLKEMGFDIKDYVRNVDTDKLVDGYLEELNMLFMYHGLSMQPGDTTEHEDATDTQYENTTYTSATVDADDGSYSIVQDVTSILPRNELKEIVGGIVESFSNDSITGSFNENFDAQVNVDCTYEDYLKIDYLANGWPYSVVRQKATMIGNRGKVKQTVVSLDSYSFAQ
jgi:hypothetical protein